MGGGVGGAIINPASGVAQLAGNSTLANAAVGNFAGVAGRTVGTDTPLGAILGPGTAAADQEKSEKKRNKQLQAFYAAQNRNVAAANERSAALSSGLQTRSS